jgi:hypothetical protein
MSKRAKLQSVRIPSEVDVNALHFFTRTDRSGRKKVYMHYGISERFVVETPWMPSWKGVEDEGSFVNATYPKYQIRCNLQDHMVPDSEHAAFATMLQRVESRIIDAAVANSLEWFQSERPLSRRVIQQDHLQPLLKYSAGRWPPEFKMKLRYFNGQWETTARREDCQEHVTEDLHAVVRGRMDVKAIVECTELWLYNNKVGCTWTVQRFKYRPTLPMYAFREDACATKAGQ